MEKAKPYDLHKIGEEGKMGDSMFYNVEILITLQRNVNSRMSLVTSVASWVISGVSVCRSKKRDSSGRKNSSQPRPVKLVQENDGSDCEYPLFHINTIIMLNLSKC